MFKVDFSSYRYVAGHKEFVEDSVTVDSLDEALGMAKDAYQISLLNHPQGYTPEVIRTAYAREWAMGLPDQWAGARFEGLSV